MRVTLIRQTTPDSEPNVLHLEPETVGDRQLLATLIDEYDIAGFGMSTITDTVLHLQLKLEPKGER